MSKLYVDRSVEIGASASRVWEVLTSQTHTQEWASEFSVGGPQIHIESDWDLHSPVLWKDRKGRVVVEGTVTSVMPGSLLRFTVSDVDNLRPVVGPEDGITFKLTERDGGTILWVSQGDFASIPDGAKYRDLSDEIWGRALARIKRLAEEKSSGPHIGQ